MDKNYRRLSTCEPKQLLLYSICAECLEIFINDTGQIDNLCPNDGHVILLVNCVDEKSALEAVEQYSAMKSILSQVG